MNDDLASNIYAVLFKHKGHEGARRKSLQIWTLLHRALVSWSPINPIVRTPKSGDFGLRITGERRNQEISDSASQLNTEIRRYRIPHHSWFVVEIYLQ